MLDVENMFFHGIDLVSWEHCDGICSTDLLESILKDKYILTRDSLYRKHSQYIGRLYGINFNGDYKVSISCHYNKSAYCFGKENGFDYSYDSVSIILKPSILSELNYIKQGIVGEYQIKGDISLDYMCGLGVPDYFDRIYTIVGNILNEDDYLEHRYDFYVNVLRNVKNINSFLEDGFYNNGYKNYEKIKDFLKTYRYDVPIVDAFTGKEWESLDVSYKKIEDIRKKTLTKKLIR